MEIINRYQTAQRFGERRDLLLLDNNVFTSKDFDRIIAEIRECGFGKDNAFYTPPNELKIAMDNLKRGWNDRAYIRRAVKLAASSGIRNLSNYLLYNEEDTPDELWQRMRLNVDLCEELGISIYSFPMKYHPIDDPKYFSNRNYIGTHWNRKFIRAVQAVLNSTKGKIGRGGEFFEEAFGSNLEDFHRILWMPETFIIYRRKYDAVLRNRLAAHYKGEEGDCDFANEWWKKFCALDEEKRAAAEHIIGGNVFEDAAIQTKDADVTEVLSYYMVRRRC